MTSLSFERNRLTLARSSRFTTSGDNDSEKKKANKFFFLKLTILLNLTSNSRSHTTLLLAFCAFLGL